MKYDVIIVGAGATGLTAMDQLVHKGFKVCLLEAASQAGGRILTLKEDGFPEPVEAGAEFIHGDLPLTIALMKEAGIAYIAVDGDMVPVHHSQWQHEDKPDEHWSSFMQQLKKLESDVSIDEFLQTHFSAPEYEELRGSVRRFAEGFDLADIKKGSMLALKDEWKEIDQRQYRVAGGYERIIKYLLNRCLLPDSEIKYNAVVEKIEFNQGMVRAYTKDGNSYEAKKIIITASVAVLQSNSIRFDPPLAAHDTAINELGFGDVIKFLFQFNEAFWMKYHNKAGFILSDENIPTWWTQLPAETNLLTGWIGGPPATALAGKSEEQLKDIGLTSLSNIFSIPVDEIEKRLLHYRVISWKDNEFIKGGYSYSTLQTAHAKKILSEPVYDTIYFAGEAMSPGDSMGTVEAAIQSGMETAKKIISGS
jgi:monoamine oxidase